MLVKISEKDIDSSLERGDYISQAREWEERERVTRRKKLLIKLFWGIFYLAFILLLLIIV